MTDCVFLRRVEDVLSLPDGVYDGVWGGYVVSFTVDGVEYEVQSKDGIRTPRAPCKVTSKDGLLSVEAVFGKAQEPNNLS